MDSIVEAADVHDTEEDGVAAPPKLLPQLSDIPVLPDMLYDERLMAAEAAVNSALDLDPLGAASGTMNDD